MKTAREAKRVVTTRFTFQGPHAREVCLAGDFNEWDPSTVPMVRQDDGSWGVALDLVPGRYEYKFVVDGEWVCEPGRSADEEHSCCVPNCFGTLNSVMLVD